jgi:cell division protein FtsZ
MAGKGMALMGTGIAEGQNRAVEAAQRAISSPLLEETSIRGAKSVLINITSSRETLRLHEVDAAAKIIEEAAQPDDTIFGAVYDETMGSRLKVTVIATGFSEAGAEHARAIEGQRFSANVVPLNPPQTGQPASGEKPAERFGSRISNLDEPAFKRRRAE